VWKASAEKELRKLPRETIARIVNLVESLAVNPYPPGSKKLTGTEHAYRVRTGDYRVDEVNGGDLIVHNVRVGHRREVYR
jgi:mRNA interferase RelE/StbE